jgi:hypothetical protein
METYGRSSVKFDILDPNVMYTNQCSVNVPKKKECSVKNRSQILEE